MRKAQDVDDARQGRLFDPPTGPHVVQVQPAPHMRACDGWCLADPHGTLVIETFDLTQQGMWERAFGYLTGVIPGFREDYWKRWEPSKRAAKRLGWSFVPVRLVPLQQPFPRRSQRTPPVLRARRRRVRAVAPPP